ncbi:MAG: hypothetical protein LBD86_03045 [Spirochaetaceae bacterium]|jgi:hypothetical protein|nr:hypothetical protein [Spirochaetaceae bacterium]
MPVFSRIKGGNGGKRGRPFTALPALPALLALLAAGGCEELTREFYYDVSVPPGIRIETAEQLANIGLVEEYPADGEYYLGNDIDLSALYEKDENRFDVTPGTPYVWRAIGSTCRQCGGPLVPTTFRDAVLPLICKNMECALYNEEQPPFSGVLHGNGKTISGLKLSGGTKDEAATDGGATDGYAGAYFIGLFGCINNAYIHDLTVELANTAEERIAYTGAYAGSDPWPSIAALAALARGSKITDITLRAAEGDCGLYVTTVLVGTAPQNIVGGAVGEGYATELTNITSSLPLDIDGNGEQYVGGIAGRIKTTGGIWNAEMTGPITVNSTGTTSEVAGICTSVAGGVIENCTVTMDELILNVAADTITSTGAAKLAGIGRPLTVKDCLVDIDRIVLRSEDTFGGTFVRTYEVGGISSSSSTSKIERCRVRFDELKVTGTETAQWGTTYIAGLAGNTGTITDSSVEGDTITVEFPYNGGSAMYIGGLDGNGNVSRSSIAGALKIDITIGTGTSGTLYAGGLTGNGVAEYSYIGSADRRATLKVTKTDTSAASTTNNAVIGGISGQTTPTAALPFRYNYAFCDVTLVTVSGSTNTSPGQAVGGLAGYISSASGTFTESYIVGSLTLTNNYAGVETAAIVFAGGLAARSQNNANLTISKCAALNGKITIDGTNTTATKTWRRIVYPASGGTSTQLQNNISNVQDVQDGSPDGTPNTANGLYVADVTEDTFFGMGTGQLGWGRDVWDWDAASGYPLLKSE